MVLKAKGMALVAAAVLLLSLSSGCSLTKSGMGEGSLMVTSTSQATVAVDGEIRGSTNEEIKSLSEGLHEVKVTPSDTPVGEAAQEDITVTVTAGEMTVVDADAGAIVDSPAEAAQKDREDEEQNGLIDDLVADPADEFADETQALYASDTQYSVTADFADRNRLPQTHVPRSRWSAYGSWGPPSADYPRPNLPGSTSADWKRARIAAVAKKYLGLPYRHRHIPAMGGLDCSNFTAWVYNYGLGTKFTSAVASQGRYVGWTVAKSNLLVGDLVFFRQSGKVVHCAIYVGGGYIVDSSTMNGKGKVAMKKLNSGWTLSHYAYAKRLIS